MAPKLRLDEEQKRVLRYLRTHGPASRSVLASRLEVSGAALTKLSRSLITLELVEEMDEEEAQGRGRPAVPLRIAAAGGYAVGTTVHKGMLELALVDYAGGVMALVREPFDRLSPEDFAKRVRGLMHELADTQHLLGKRLLGVGIGVPGMSLSPDGNKWGIVESLPGWRDMSLGEFMDDALGLPIWIENDANTAALAEYYLGDLMPHCSTAVVILLGHGIGAGVIIDGRLLKGQTGNAGDIGCLYPPDRPRPSTLDLMAALHAAGCDITSVADFEARTAGYGATVQAWLTRAASQLELVVNSGFIWFDAGEIIISSPLPQCLLKDLADRLNNAELVSGPGGARRPRVSVSKLGGSATTLGAALLPIHASASLG